jgi:hypothetical protein
MVMVMASETAARAANAVAHIKGLSGMVLLHRLRISALAVAWLVRLEIPISPRKTVGVVLETFTVTVVPEVLALPVRPAAVM